MRALKEVGTVIVAGFFTFFTGLLMMAAVLILWLLGVASTLMLMVSGFAGVMYLITGRTHDARIGLVYLGYAAVPFTITFVFHVYRGKWCAGLQRSPRHAPLAYNVSPFCRIATDAK